MAVNDSDPSVLGPTTRVTGNINGKGGLRVEGTVHGDISVDGPSEILANAAVTGDFRAESLDIAGTLEGSATTTGVIRIRSTAVVHGKMSGSEVSIEDGARVSVRLDTDFDGDF